MRVKFERRPVFDHLAAVFGNIVRGGDGRPSDAGNFVSGANPCRSR